MMKCQSCGADYDNEALVCPYCGAENEAAAKREQQAVLDEYKEKMENISEEVPAETMKKANRNITRIIIGIVIAFFVVFAIVQIVSNILADTALKRQQKYKSTLETYYQNGQYEEMKDLIYSSDEIYGATYEKYLRVIQIYEWEDMYLYRFEEYVEYLKEDDIWAENVAWTLCNTFDVLKKLKTWEEEGYVYGEGDGAENCKSKFYEALRTHFLLTDEEIASGMAIEEPEHDGYTAYMDMVKLITERLRAVR